MSSPNLITVTSTIFQTAYALPGVTTAYTSFTYYGTTALTGMTPASLTVNKIDSIIVSNTTSSAATASVAVSNNATFASGTIYYVAYQISVPPNASIIVVDKTTPLYITDSQSLAVYSGTASALTFTLPFEIITASS
jgi:hypothetical protein